LKDYRYRCLLLYFAVSVSLFLAPSNVKSQVHFFEWARSLGGPLQTFGGDVVADAAGNVYTVGHFAGTVDFDPGPGVVNRTATNYDLYISKLDAAGNFVWAIALGEAGYDVAWAITIDPMDNIYVTGSFEGITDFDPGPGVSQLVPVGESDIFVSKFTSAGNLIWVKQMAGPNIDGGLDIALDQDGNVYTAGQFRDSVDFDPGPGIFQLSTTNTDDAFISKLDSNGNFVWARNMGGTGPDHARSIAVDPVSGSVYATGIFTGTADFDLGFGTYPLTSNGSYDIYVLKLDAAGNFVWAKQVGASQYDVGYGIAVDGSGNVTTTGYFMGSADFDPGAGQSYLTGGNIENAFILQLDPAGDFLWARQFGSASDYVNGWSITHDDDHNVYAVGIFYGTVDFDPGMGVYNLTSNGYDSYISKLDSAGNFVWVKPITGSGAQSVRNISMDAANHIYTTGQFNGTGDFDPGPAVFNMTAVNFFDAFTQKLRQCNASHATTEVTACNSYTSPSGNHTWTSSGTYGDTLPNAGGCDSILTIKLTVLEIPVQPGAISGDDTVCSGSSNVYTILPLPGATAYTWTLPGGWTGTSTTNSIVTTATATSGILTVTAYNICGTSASQSLAVTISPDPTAAFSFTTNLLAATFTNMSAGATTWAWDFGDGSSSTLQHPTYTYSTAGIYTVCLTATANGCVDSICQNITVISVGMEDTIPGLTVFPNPSHGRFYLHTDHVLDGEVIDCRGKVVLQTTFAFGQNEIDLTDCAEGIYFLRVKNSVSSRCVKLVKMKVH
jgi:PKD repeat protein